MKEFWKNANKDLLNKEELKEKRTLTSKTFNLGGGKYHLRECENIVHYLKDGVLRDINLNPKDMLDYWLIDVVGFKLTLPKNEPSFTIDGITYKCLEKDCKIIDYNLWEGDDYIIRLNISATGIKTITELNGAKTLSWSVNGEIPNLEIHGYDSANNNIDVKKTFKNGILTEIFTGQIRKIINKKTRQRELSYDVVYPVKMRG